MNIHAVLTLPWPDLGLVVCAAGDASHVKCEEKVADFAALCFFWGCMCVGGWVGLGWMGRGGGFPPFLVLDSMVWLCDKPWGA